MLFRSEALSRSQSMNVGARPLPRVRRGSVVGSSGIVAGLANRWDPGSSNGGGEGTLAQFPSPPRASLPPVPNSRPVSKLDRSKYQAFA